MDGLGITLLGNDTPIDLTGSTNGDDGDRPRGDGGSSYHRTAKFVKDSQKTSKKRDKHGGDSKKSKRDGKKKATKAISDPNLPK